MIHRLASFFVPLCLGLAAFNHPYGFAQIAVFIVLALMGLGLLAGLAILSPLLWSSNRQIHLDMEHVNSGMSQEHE